MFVWSTAHWSFAATLEGHDAWGKSLDFSPDSKKSGSRIRVFEKTEDFSIQLPSPLAGKEF